jgi:hypothetical protein
MVWKRAKLSNVVLHHEHTLVALGSLRHVAPQVLTKDLILVNVMVLDCGSLIKNLLEGKLGLDVS